ncbi:hypothetical protein [Aquimarina sp. 2201CG14-23]|uniref:hypothetical protein n=1 Tax=Aquimarina mycalae TaxID=3040073 RepID=UPI002477E96B|nr:hypothetical protein [Aquimarina sp. 2201CG14-23]MDH7444676.1 hypothetical protein [Aquimarina sp. 2201CG14-23]
MRQTSDLINAYLTGFNSEYDGIKLTDVSPIVAWQDAKYPFAVFKIDRRPAYSKNGMFEYDVQIRIISENYESLMDLTDGLTEFLDQYKELIYQGTESEINPDKPSEHIITNTYQIIKNS